MVLMQLPVARCSNWHNDTIPVPLSIDTNEYLTGKHDTKVSDYKRLCNDRSNRRSDFEQKTATTAKTMKFYKLLPFNLKFV